MKQTFLLREACLLLLIVLLFLACEKDNKDGSNTKLYSNAGTDRTILFPQDSVHLDGSSSTDLDGIITSYKWEKTSGPAQFKIENANAAVTAVTGLEDGIYLFQLTVKDNKGRWNTDMVRVTMIGMSSCNNANVRVASGPGELIDFGSLSFPRNAYMTGAVADKMFFAGGYTTATHNNDTPVDRVDIYNFTTKTWSTAPFVNKDYIKSIIVGDKVLFIRHNSEIDIYNATSDSWSVLSPNPLVGRDLPLTTAVLGSKVFFAGSFSGASSSAAINVSTEVDIYDAASKSWSSAQLSEGRAGMITAAVGNKLVFAGGYRKYNWMNEYVEDPSSKIDIYDGTNNTWSTADLPQPVLFGSAAVAGNKAVFAFDATSNISIFDAASNSWSAATISKTKSGVNVVSTGNKILVPNGYDESSGYSSRVNVYDASSGTWTTANMSRPGTIGWSSGVGNKSLLSVWHDNEVMFEVYDAGSNTFTPVQLSHTLATTPVAANGKLYIGGTIVDPTGSQLFDAPSCKVWQFEFK